MIVVSVDVSLKACSPKHAVRSKVKDGPEYIRKSSVVVLIVVSFPYSVVIGNYQSLLIAGVILIGTLYTIRVNHFFEKHPS